MKYEVIILKSAEKNAATLAPKNRQRIADAIASLATDPFRGMKLHDDLVGARSIRVWPYRIVYTIDKKMVTVIVLRIGHGKDVYK